VSAANIGHQTQHRGVIEVFSALCVGQGRIFNWHLYAAISLWKAAKIAPLKTALSTDYPPGNT
jgi:hypothetical protein